MLTKPQAIAVAAATGIAAVIGAGMFQIAHNAQVGQANKGIVEPAIVQESKPSTVPPQSQVTSQTNPAATADPRYPPLVQAQLNSASPTNHTATPSFGTATIRDSSVVTKPGAGYATTNGSTSTLVSETPKVGYLSPTTTTVVERQTVYTTRPVYATRVVVRHRHHSSGKVHVARAAKHTVMFVAKLPGRMRL
jgi:hypothetical protein